MMEAEDVPTGPKTAEPPTTVAKLHQAVRAADPAAFLVLPRILRRVIKQDRQLTGFGLRPPHRKSYTIDRGPLLEIVEPAELGLPDTAAVPEKVILLAQPSAWAMEEVAGETLLLRCWQLLFHARLHLALEAKAAEFDPPGIRRRIHEIGEAAFDEIRNVLAQEDMLLPPKTDASIYVEFVATYFELRRFAPSFLPRYFPSLANFSAIERVLSRDVDADSIFRATRPVGAPQPHDAVELHEWLDLSPNDHPAETAEAPPAAAPSEWKFRALMRRAQSPSLVGNVVRAAIYHARAARYAPSNYAARVETAIKGDMDRLAVRLQVVFEASGSSAQPWRESLTALARQTPRGIWTVEARLLYDLQKACVDHEREIYAIDLIEWALSRGKRPIKRRLPSQRDALLLKHLRSAARRLSAARISDDQRRQLAVLLRDAIARVESRLRERLRPRIVASLDDVGLVATNLPERVARKKLVEELLDQIEERGYLAMGDLRDAISRNRLKLPDLYRPLETPAAPAASGWALFLNRVWRVLMIVMVNVREFFRGDLLLRADRRLGLSLDGVYRRGEFYLRWMQRLSSLGFGTWTGRLFTRFVGVPFGGAFVVLAGLHHLWEIFEKWRHPTEQVANAAPKTIDFFALPVFLLGLFLLLLINSPGFRRMVADLFVRMFQILRTIIVEPVRWLIQWPALQAFLHSRAWLAVYRFLLKPLLWAFVAWLILPMDDKDWQVSLITGLFLFVGANLLLNSRMGRTAEEVVVDEIVQAFRRFGVRAIIGLFWAVVDLFKRLMQTVERLMYAIDEWLRFRTGESRLSLTAKALLGAVWFFVAYLLRFAISVLVEPQINPIKHFPVVTVGHKLLLPLIPSFAGVLELTMEKPLALTVAVAVITSIPGIFGFLVWELKENWRLYAANRPPKLVPVPLGSHGETMARLLRPGFHSGTLPKRFAKLRRAERRARAGGSWSAVQKHLSAIHHIETGVRRFVERELIELLVEREDWPARVVSLAGVRLGTNSVRLTLKFSHAANAGEEYVLQLVIDTRAGWLLADSGKVDWLSKLGPSGQQMLVNAVAGLYAIAGLDLVRRQVESEFPPPAPWFDVSPKGLHAWPDDDRQAEVFYDLSEEPWIAPQHVAGLPRLRMPTLEHVRLMFGANPILWDRWVLVWDVNRDSPIRPVISARVLSE